MKISKKQVRHIREVLDREGIDYLNETLSEWFPNVEEPLFTTEDGIDIYKGDKCWAGVPEKGIEDFILDHWGGYTGSLKFFSTKDTAQKYINETVVKYTSRDVLRAVNNWSMKPVDIENINKFLNK